MLLAACALMDVNWVV